jgi:hypothetical protein
LKSIKFGLFSTRLFPLAFNLWILIKNVAFVMEIMFYLVKIYLLMNMAILRLLGSYRLQYHYQLNIIIVYSSFYLAPERIKIIN